MTRADRHHNPTAFTSDLARTGGLELGKDYTIGETFPGGTLTTAMIVGDPVQVTIKLIDKVGFHTKIGTPRWTYIAMPKFVWDSLTTELKTRVIGWMYGHESGTEMQGLFPA